MWTDVNTGKLKTNCTVCGAETDAKVGNKYYTKCSSCGRRERGSIRPPLNNSLVEMGRNDFRNGVKRVPALSKNLLNYIGSNNKEIGTALPSMKAWIKGWDAENLKRKK